MCTRSFAEYLSGVDESSLTALLQARPDVLVQPVPQGFSQPAQRLGGAESLAVALRSVNRDTVIVGQAIAALGPSATVPVMIRLLGASEQSVHAAVGELCRRGLAWDSAGVWYLPQRLAAHWLVEIGGGRPLAKIAASVLADDLRVAVRAFGDAADGLRKPELAARLSEFMSDLPVLVKVIAELPAPVRDRLGQYRRSPYSHYSGRSKPGDGDRDPTQLLVAAGLLLPVHYGLELPREVAVASWLAERELHLTGRPDIPAVAADEAAVCRAAQAAARGSERNTGPRVATGALTRMTINSDNTAECLVASTPHAEALFESDERLRRAACATKTVRVVQPLIVPRHAAMHAMTARLANPTGSAYTAAPAHLLHQSDDTDQPTRRLPTATLRVSPRKFKTIATVDNDRGSRA